MVDVNQRCLSELRDGGLSLQDRLLCKRVVTKMVGWAACL